MIEKESFWVLAKESKGNDDGGGEQQNGSSDGGARGEKPPWRSDIDNSPSGATEEGLLKLPWAADCV